MPPTFPLRLTHTLPFDEARTRLAAYVEQHGNLQIPASSRPLIVIHQSTRPPLAALQTHAGGTLVDQNKRGTVYFMWQASGERAVIILSNLLPLMSRRREVVEQLIAAWDKRLRERRVAGQAYGWKVIDHTRDDMHRRGWDVRGRYGVAL